MAPTRFHGHAARSWTNRMCEQRPPFVDGAGKKFECLGRSPARGHGFSDRFEGDHFFYWLEVLQVWRFDLISSADAPRTSVAGLFKRRQFEPEVILLAVGWYLRFSLSYRDVEELLAERGLHADHVTVRAMGYSVTPRSWNDVCAASAWRTIAGYEAIHMIHKRQACESAPGGRAVLLHRFILGLFSEVAV
jgi:hypothetical protein